MKYIQDFCIIKTSKLFREEMKVNNIKILLDVKFHPEKHVHNEGIVVSVPDKLSSSVPFALNRLGQPDYFQAYPNQCIWLNQIPITLKEGDTVFYHHNVPLNKENILKVEDLPDGTKEYYLKVSYQNIFTAKRGKQFFPNATWTMVDPDRESWDDILIPIPKSENGKPVFKYSKKFNRKTGIMETVAEMEYLPKDKWLVKKSSPEDKPLKGTIIAIGEPLIGDTCEVKKGDRILYRRNADFSVFIEGKRYLMMKQRFILAKIEQVK